MAWKKLPVPDEVLRELMLLELQRYPAGKKCGCRKLQKILAEKYDIHVCHVAVNDRLPTVRALLPKPPEPPEPPKPKPEIQPFIPQEPVILLPEEIKEVPGWNKPPAPMTQAEINAWYAQQLQNCVKSYAKAK